MTPITCTKCEAVVAKLENGKIVVDTKQARVLERDTLGNVYCICKGCGRKKIIRHDWLGSQPDTVQRSGRRVF